MTQHRTREEQIISLGARIFTGSDSLTDATCLAARHIKEAEDRATAALRAENERLREALGRVSHSLTCGCAPCRGDCWSREGLLDEINGRAQIAFDALSPAIDAAMDREGRGDA